MTEEVISVVLLPELSDSNGLVDISTALNKQAPGLIQLGPDALPHITIAQFVAPHSELDRLKEEIDGLNLVTPSLTAAGLNFYPEVKRNVTWVEVSFLKSVELHSLQMTVFNTQFAAQYPYLGGKGDLYRPHCTVGLFKGRSSMSFELDNPELLRKSFASLRLAIGPNGNNFVFSRVI